MSQLLQRIPSFGFALLLIAANFTLAQVCLADEPPTTASTARKAATQEPLFELRIYTAAPGKLESLNRRFREHTLRLFAKHGIQSVGYWTTVDEKEQGRLYYILRYPNRESREKMLIEGIAKDPEFLKAVAESEKDGKLTDGVESVLLLPTDYSPIQ